MFQATTEFLVDPESTCPTGRSSKLIFLDMDASAWGTWDGRIKLGAASSSHKVVFFNSLGDPWVNGDRVTSQSEAGSDVVYNCTGFTQVAAPGQKFKIGLVFFC